MLKLRVADLVQDYPILRIRQVGSKLECELTNPTSMQIPGIEVKPWQQKAKKIHCHYMEILRMVGGLEQPNIKDFMKGLKTLGREIGDILRVILENLAFEIRKDCSLALALDDEMVKIPWELGLLPKSFTGEKDRKFLCDIACIGRLRVVKSDSWKPSPKKRKSGRALVVGINYNRSKKDSRRGLRELEHAEEEAEEVTEILSHHDMRVTKLLGPKATSRSVLKELRQGVDIFHFTGHGGTSWNKSKICLWDKDLWAKDLERALEYSNSPAPSLSFINACETSVDIHRKGKVTWAPYSWAFALANQDGSVFIGTLWSVYEEEALQFAKSFYTKFLGFKNKSLAKAMHDARIEAKRRGSNAILSWPAYVLYGPPTLNHDLLLAK